MEKATYRENLEMLMRLFPDKAVITPAEAAKALGITTKTLLRDETFPAQKVGGKYHISIANFARWLAV